MKLMGNKFLLSVSITCATFLEVVGVGLDQGLVDLSSQFVSFVYQVLSAFEAVIGVLAVCLASYSVDLFCPNEASYSSSRGFACLMAAWLFGESSS